MITINNIQGDLPEMMVVSFSRITPGAWSASEAAFCKNIPVRRANEPFEIMNEIVTSSVGCGQRYFQS